jgi:hypothetical protein
MIGKTTRNLTVSRIAYEKGARIELPDDQFATLEVCGLVERVKPRTTLKKIAD